ncbi:MAG: hypothetical protein RMI79_05095 [Nitrososphaerota archaeon]|nr:hypothetical protein [Nitrososphaerota archaeon]
MNLRRGELPMFWLLWLQHLWEVIGNKAKLFDDVYRKYAVDNRCNITLIDFVKVYAIDPRLAENGL